MNSRMVVSMSELAECAGHMGYDATHYPGCDKLPAVSRQDEKRPDKEQKVVSKQQEMNLEM